jgi:hypothetical protein
MNPLQILANIGLSLADLAELGPYAADLRGLGSIWKSWTQAQSWLKSVGREVTPSAAVRAYQAARLWAHQEQWLPSIGAGYTVPTAMAATVARGPVAEGMGAVVRYDVTIQVDFPRTGISQPYTVSLNLPGAVSEAEAISLGKGLLQDRLEGWGYDPTGLSGAPFEWDDARVAGFFRYAN